MRNVFILYMPESNYEAMTHYQDTIINKVQPERIFRYVDYNLRNQLTNIFGNRPIAVWGSRDSAANRSRFENMSGGDDILIVEGGIIKLLGKIACKTISPDLSKELWKNLRGDEIEGWNLIYFIANPLEIEIPFDEFRKLFNYSPNWTLRGLTSVSNDKLEDFYSRYDDLYSILIKLKNREEISEIKEQPVDTKQDEIEQTLESVDEKEGFGARQNMEANRNFAKQMK